MKILFAVISILLLVPAASAELIHNFEVEIFISKDSSINVEEKISYDFERELKRGIFRNITYKYNIEGKNYNLRMNFQGVSDFEGSPYKYETYSQGSDKFIKIGDPDVEITGSHDYKIGYNVERAVVFFDDHDELYWNVTGNGWQVPMGRVSAKVYLEGDMPASGVRAKCYTGYEGSRNENCSYEIASTGVEFRSNSGLAPGEGLTIVLGLPKGIIQEPSQLQKAAWFLADNWHFGFPLLTLFALTFIWRSMGRDPEGKVAVAVKYEPPVGLTPAEAGTLIDERADLDDITSTIIDLAVRGYIKIEEIESEKILYFFSNTDYRLKKLKDDTAGLKAHEREILSGIFGAKNQIMISELKNKFYTRLPGIKDSLYRELIKSGFFPVSPEKIRGIFKWIGVGVGALGLFLPVADVILKIALVASGVIFIIFSRFMPRKTKKGSLAKDELLGFREFIERAEKDRIERLAKEDPTLFDRVLPFAVVFDLADRWAEAFVDIYKTPPSWFSSNRYGSSFSPGTFAGDIGRSLGAINQTLASSPSKSRSGGSGFSGGRSGGGFGGGGGGSW